MPPSRRIRLPRVKGCGDRARIVSAAAGLGRIDSSVLRGMRQRFDSCCRTSPCRDPHPAGLFFCTGTGAIGKSGTRGAARVDSMWTHVPGYRC
jgi:hypothetical protein